MVDGDILSQVVDQIDILSLRLQKVKQSFDLLDARVSFFSRMIERLVYDGG